MAAVHTRRGGRSYREYTDEVRYDASDSDEEESGDV